MVIHDHHVVVGSLVVSLLIVLFVLVIMVIIHVLELVLLKHLLVLVFLQQKLLLLLLLQRGLRGNVAWEIGSCNVQTVVVLSA